MLFVTTEVVNLDPKSEKTIFALYLPVPSCVGLLQNGFLIHGAGVAAADMSQGLHSDACYVQK